MNTKTSYKILLCIILSISLAACSTLQKNQRDGAPKHPKDVSHVKAAVPRKEHKSKYGNPESYVVRHKRYHTLKTAKGYKEKGYASWYGTKFHGQLTSTREPYNMYKMTAAHKTLPLPSYVKVKNLKNGKSTIVRVNDRGPFHEGRIIDLSYAAAKKIGVFDMGTAPVEVTAIIPGEKLKPDNKVLPPVNDVQYVKHDETKAKQASPLYVQAGAFSIIENAMSQADTIRALVDKPVTIEKVIDATNILYKIEIGPINDEKDLTKMATKLAQAAINYRVKKD